MSDLIQTYEEAKEKAYKKIYEDRLAAEAYFFFGIVRPGYEWWAVDRKWDRLIRSVCPHKSGQLYLGGDKYRCEVCYGYFTKE